MRLEIKNEKTKKESASICLIDIHENLVREFRFEFAKVVFNGEKVGVHLFGQKNDEDWREQIVHALTIIAHRISVQQTGVSK